MYFDISLSFHPRLTGYFLHGLIPFSSIWPKLKHFEKTLVILWKSKIYNGFAAHHIPCSWFKIENSFRLLEQNLAHFIHTVHYYACFGTSCEESKFSASYKSIPFQVKMVCQFFFFNNKRLLLLSATPSNHKLFKFK